ncbi:hypothetical protein B0J14DRAFT_558019 [Halenospora varia]|nr:hypothetical protein B0J14DRAFT_558019 [Halenospora varia]
MFCFCRLEALDERCPLRTTVFGLMRDLIVTSRTNPHSFLHVRSKYILIHSSSDELSEEFLHRSEKRRRIAIEEHSSVPVTHVIYKSARDDHGVQRVTLQECMGMFRAGSEAGVAEPIANQSFQPSGACSQHGNAGCYTLALSGQHTVAPVHRPQLKQYGASNSSKKPLPRPPGSALLVAPNNAGHVVSGPTIASRAGLEGLTIIGAWFLC